ncbi:SDR family NAD(P)-dependent oxidoreductase [Actinomadura soli]|uniref:SDR family NAD(P)-dependent oxidoreductase n=1 Tax=Actinomadura soli TaxID=2508997 RepID=A0A5C4J657_9ACTN|nr:SDR family NAD(P)-dependent oxidoreductase [Actinomadura soli]TMQ91292.1 SDR family NAD(P)-dependent oxidoreductase [Actinomadura soli]
MICRDRVVAITGAGRGLGRAHALEFARQGARVIVNDLGVARDGTGNASSGPAHDVVQQIRSLGGQAVAHTDDIATDEGADVTGRIFEAEAGKICVMDAFRHGPSTDKGARWNPSEIGEAVTALLAKAPTPESVYGA